MRLVRKGCTRLVLIIGEYAIKIPNFTYSWEHFIKGIIANIEEKKIWDLSGIEDCGLNVYRGNLCPVKWSSIGCLVIIMPKCQRELSDYEYVSMGGCAVDTMPGGDNKASNFMWLNGSIVKVDYGG